MLEISILGKVARNYVCRAKYNISSHLKQEDN